jgi:hypothetical protein
MSIYFAVVAPRPFESADVLPVMLHFPKLRVDMEGSMRFVRGLYNDGGSLYAPDIHLTWVRLQPTQPLEYDEMIVYVNYSMEEIETNETISEIRTTLSYLSEAKRIYLHPMRDGVAFIMEGVNVERLTEVFTEQARSSIQLVK